VGGWRKQGLVSLRRAAASALRRIRLWTPQPLRTLAPHLHEVGVLGVPHHDQAVHVVLQLALFGVRHRDVVLGQPRLARAVLQQDEPDHAAARACRLTVPGASGRAVAGVFVDL